MDIVDSKTRSRMMSGIRGKNTKPELTLRRNLFAMGFRYRLHAALPGKPDLAFRKHNAVVFVHGCFWHRHEGCRLTTTPSTRAAFWQEKFDKNVERDKRNMSLLMDAEWRIAVVWECALRSDAPAAASAVAEWLIGEDGTLEVSRTDRRS